MAVPEQGSEGSGPALDDLPDPVRHRVVSLVAAVLPEVTSLPPALRRIRDFAPTRRARAGAGAIRTALADSDFRRRAALAVPDQGDDDLVTVAARAWLHRGASWGEDVARALDELAERERGGALEAERTAHTAERVVVAEAALREARSRHRAELAEAKTENARLRRSLGEERRAARAVREALEAALTEARATQSAALVAGSARDRELRQLQARIARLDADGASQRRTTRVEREDTTLRARLLLDTVIDAASGLRRELALPAATATPGARVEQGLVALEGVREPSSVGQLGPDSAALLDQYLTMPRARLVVDGYNVTKSTWGSLPLESQRIRLVNALAPLVARTGAETTVVFDAHQVGSRPVIPSPRGVRVVFSPEGVIADDVIRDLVEAEPTGRVVVVVSDDGELTDDVRRDGARVCAARSLIRLLGG